MAKPEWGAKRTCHNCGARFYDLCREPIVCPVCSTVYDVERQPRARRGGVVLKDDATSRARVPKEVVASELADDVVDEADGDPDAENDADTESDGDSENVDDLANEDQDLIEDASDLGEDGDDIGEVMEHIDEDVEDKS